MEDNDRFDKTEYGLVPLVLDDWAGFYFVRFAPTGISLREHLGDMPDVFASHKCEELVCVKTAAFDLRCNWKLILENALEDYHAGFVHRNSIGAQTALPQPTRGNWDSLYVAGDTAVGVLPGESTPFPFIAGLEGAARSGSYFTVIYPNTQFCFTQDCMWWLTVTPVAADRSILHVGYCFPQETVARADFADAAKPYFKRWQLTAEEDNAICELQQSGLSSIYREPGPLSPRESMVERFDRRIAEAMSGAGAMLT